MFGCLASLFKSTAAAPVLAVRDNGPHAVFAHLIIGIASQMTWDKWVTETRNAQAMGVDAWVLNIGKDPYTDAQLDMAYNVAEQLGFKCLLSFDMNWGTSYWGPGDEGAVQAKTFQYGSRASQFRYNGKIIVSSFNDDKQPQFNWASFDHNQIFVVPHIQQGSVPSRQGIDGALNWNAWPSSFNEPISGPMTMDSDHAYTDGLNGRAYIALISPWFFTRWPNWPQGTGWAKNHLFVSDTLWIDRWKQMLQLTPTFVEIYSWNDYGESTYIGSLIGQPTDDKAYYAVGMPHDAWRAMAAPYIAAYKAGASDVTITTEKLFYWYRVTPKGLDCGPDPPKGNTLPADNIYVSAFLKIPGEVFIGFKGRPGGQSFKAPAGVSTFSIPMPVDSLPATPYASVSRGGKLAISSMKANNRPITWDCAAGYNFNAVIGVVP
jgi:glucan endo-1,3-alpha-glucosidase